MTQPTTDLAHDVLRQERHPLAAFFSPQAVALIGATETAGSVGRTVLRNLVANPFGGTVFPVNPKRPSVLGIKAYPSIADVPAKVDLAVLVTPAPSVPGLVRECVEAGVRAAIIISAGFKELGPPGAALEQQVYEEARKGRMRIIGPNCLGVMSPVSGLNATFAAGMARPGNVALVSQSGALLTAILDWAAREQVGFSACVSTGSMLDVGWGDLIDHFGNDAKTHSIVVYMESIGDARAFLSAAREVALNKPIIVIKAGRTEAASKAAASHTGSLTGSDAVLDAAFRRTGVLRVDTISELFSMAGVLAKQPRPKGPRLTIVTNAGGPGVLATDELVTNGGELAALSPTTLCELSGFLPAAWSHANPIDILGDAPPDRYARALELAARDPNSDGLLVILTPQDMTDPTLTAEALRKYAQIPGKPVLASWMGGPEVEAGETILSRANIPTFAYPDLAAQAFTAMWRSAYNLRGIYETPSLGTGNACDAELARGLIDRARAEGRTLLDEYESKQLLAAYCLPTVPTRLAQSAREAAEQARQLGFPVVLKIHSRTITHKTDVGGVKLSLVDEQAVARAFEEIRESVTRLAGAEHFLGVTVQPMVRAGDGYELILGSSVDPQFGPVLLFGTGGQLVEVFQDRSLALPPLNATLARRMMEATRIFKALQGVRGRKPVDLAQLEQVLVRFSQLVVEQRWIKEIDMNPLLVSADAMVALDARVVLHGAEVQEAQLPRLAIRPYPSEYAAPWRLPDGTEVMIRPIRPEDEPAMVRFHQTLSDRSVRLRYFAPMKLGQRTTHERLVRVCFNDYDRELALVVERGRGADQEIIAVGRLSRLPWVNEAEWALLVRDDMQGKGLGSELLRRLVDVGRREKLAVLTAYILPDNLEMQKIAERQGFRLRHLLEEHLVRAELRY